MVNKEDIANLTAREVAQRLEPYGVALGGNLRADKITAYISLLLRWNKAISLTTVTDPGEILRFHFGESLFASSFLDLKNGRLADVGSGAGFPGLPLAMANQSLNVTLIESNAKKAAFLSEVTRSLELQDVTVARSRMEDLPADSKPFDFITARALGQFDSLLSWAHNHVSKDGRIILWLGESDIKTVSANSSWQWQPPVQIPGSDRRFILVGSTKKS